ncbi:MAG: YgiQ family radical SAM protein [Candidatus Aenigmarchaeota archaeon CG_4_10_14_0_8_um_filter_37_24]|nr:YgiQ family radical SAM protein [Candidatus Aenigmarchaeota archaeon]OIN86956.1 MAG: YgiQ family radical SAM protein [Candidatus Aenigmarchaeota archaeon CG1_02_38_14]PIV69330.1 MAG: YgiQ family radical SAM protein [Candidatus Aenigmarchaeota archaeon CG01_land_8_20_14_3_00_37_9]PIW41268.1 MAG: YgiQ family radical SAM protein [Candidatus Aenigmarchaeota archaeon CG15_BIG_FIL_POST_REV_8_21_14_020_37_27]PIX50878.1 MAG: YgiQ family radical SAM protein [Candidatus Aenigmarchaeota archaeon CG_4_8
MISKEPLPHGKQFDIILITGDIYIDHPLCGTAVIARVLEKNGYSVGIIETPDWKKDKDFKKLGKPNLFFGISSGSMDSMLDNYTPLKKKRSFDKYRKYRPKKPDRAVIVYANMARKNFKDSPIVIGGIEASLRRFVHYDYWDNDLRKSILLDSRADILAYGCAEHSIIEIAKRYEKKLPVDGIDGTCIAGNTAPTTFKILPSFDEVKTDKKKFCEFQMMLNNSINLAQKIGDKYILQYKSHEYTQKELDRIYGLNYSRDIPKEAGYFKGMQFSVVTHRGCIGECSFCSISLHQGNHIVSRSEQSILKEIENLTKHKDFKGYIDDLGGPSANMYGMDCMKCGNDCIFCKSLDRSHSKLIKLLRKARKIKGVKKIFVRSGIRYDIAADSEEYIKEISENHTSGYLKIAPEHSNPEVLELMNKHFPGRLEKFVDSFKKINKTTGQYLRYYFITAHPGSSEKENRELKIFLKGIKENAIIQVFTPTPMTMSTCMYYTSIDPKTGKAIYVPYTYREKKDQKSELYKSIR